MAVPIPISKTELNGVNKPNRIHKRPTVVIIFLIIFIHTSSYNEIVLSHRLINHERFTITARLSLCTNQICDSHFSTRHKKTRNTKCSNLLKFVFPIQ